MVESYAAHPEDDVDVSVVAWPVVVAVNGTPAVEAKAWRTARSILPGSGKWMKRVVDFLRLNGLIPMNGIIGTLQQNGSRAWKPRAVVA